MRRYNGCNASFPGRAALMPLIRVPVGSGGLPGSRGRWRKVAQSDRQIRKTHPSRRSWEPIAGTIVVCILGIASGKVLSVILLAGFVAYFLTSLSNATPGTHFSDLAVFIFSVLFVQLPVDVRVRYGTHTGVKFQKVVYALGSYGAVRALESTGQRRDVDFTVEHTYPILTLPIKRVVVFFIRDSGKTLE